jgi:hypothetical protein
MKIFQPKMHCFPRTRDLLLPRLLSGQVALDEREDAFQNTPA